MKPHGAYMRLKFTIVALLACVSCTKDSDIKIPALKDVTVKVSVTNLIEGYPSPDVKVQLSDGASPQAGLTDAGGNVAFIFKNVPAALTEVEVSVVVFPKDPTLPKRFGVTRKKLLASDRFIEINVALQDQSGAKPSVAESVSISSNDMKIVNDQSIPIGTSLTKGQKHEIQMLEIYEVRNLAHKLWFAGKGYALINNGGGFYYWKSPTPPQLEVEIDLAGVRYTANCETLIKAGIPKSKLLSVVGSGFFKGTQVEGRSLGVFRLHLIDQCGLIDKV